MLPPPNSPDRAKGRARARRVAFLSCAEYVQVLDRMDTHKRRDVMLDDLFQASGIAEWISVVAPAKASSVHLSRFHAEDYVRILCSTDPLESDDSTRHEIRSDEIGGPDLDQIGGEVELGQKSRRRAWQDNVRASGDLGSDAKDNEDTDFSTLESHNRKARRRELEQHGLEDDCSPFAGHFEYSCHVAGASIQAADMLARGKCDVAINWGGGRHHAKKACAAGFCFVNDCVLSCLHLLRRFRRVLYFDIDVHHGDGVQEAFAHDDTLLFVSMHYAARGFFPGTGAAREVGEGGPGLFHTLNLPLKPGASDETFSSVFTEVFDRCLASYRPDAVVLCVGADTLGCDPLGCFNLTTRGISDCVRHAANRCFHGHPSRQKRRPETPHGEPDCSSHTSGSSSNCSNTDSSCGVGAALLQQQQPQQQEQPKQQHNLQRPGEEVEWKHEAAASEQGHRPQPAASPAAPSAKGTAPIPLLMLGGGGYSPSHTARAWMCCTAAAAGPYVEEKVFPSEVPSSCRSFEEHGPDFMMHPWAKGQLPSLRRQDENSPDHVARLKAHAARILSKVHAHRLQQRSYQSSKPSESEEEILQSSSTPTPAAETAELQGAAAPPVAQEERSAIIALGTFEMEAATEEIEAKAAPAPSLLEIPATVPASCGRAQTESPSPTFVGKDEAPALSGPTPALGAVVELALGAQVEPTTVAIPASASVLPGASVPAGTEEESAGFI